jgi:CRISPR-associated endonuclease/helicase Cas3
VRDLIARWENEFDEMDIAAPDRRLLALAKVLVLAADVAGSALPKAAEKATAWIPIQLARRSTRSALEALIARRLGGAQLRPFQENVAASDAPVTLVTAGCGSGKTLGAWAWAARQHPQRQFWMTYPTTGTATEGFRDYVHGADIEARLEHGRAVVDLEIFGLAEGDVMRDRDRLDALRAWGVAAITCTVDTLLGLLQNQRKGLYAFPGIADAAVVFDEVHSYDERLFATLLRFLDDLPGIPALVMTASLPAARLAALRTLVARRHGRALHEVSGPPELEALPRYRFLDSETLPIALVGEALGRGEKVLWVSNTVGRCMASGAGLPGLVYHSRFRYCDRVARHSAVIEAFRQPGPALATTTQVAEMSLDLSADLLVTDLAPVSALIQRLGRLNRRSTPEAPIPVRPFVVLPFAGAPYKRGSLEQASGWLSTLRSRELSQRDLVMAWNQPAVQPPAPGRSSWLDGGFHTDPVEVRLASPGITVLLEADARDVATGRRRAEEMALAMGPPPHGLDPAAWRRVEYLPVVPEGLISYDPMRGAAWRKG